MLKAIWKNFWIVVLVTLLSGVLTFVGTKLLVKPTYRTNFTAYVNNKKEVDLASLTSSDVAASQALVTSYSQIITSRSVLTSAAKSLGLDYGYGKLKSMVSTEVSKKSEIITVYVVSQDPEEAFRLASAVERKALEYTEKIVEGSSMKIIDDPVYSNSVFRPNYLKRSLVGALVGLFLTVLIICIRQITNDTIRDENEFSQRYAIPIVGVIPDMLNVDKNKGGYYYYYYGDPSGEEAQNTATSKGEGKA